jgi:hypothetical protein
MKTERKNRVLETWDLYIPDKNKDGKSLYGKDTDEWFVSAKKILKQPPENRPYSFDKSSEKRTSLEGPSQKTMGATFSGGDLKQIKELVSMTLKYFNVEFVQIVRTQFKTTEYTEK